MQDSSFKKIFKCQQSSTASRSRSQLSNKIFIDSSVIFHTLSLETSSEGEPSSADLIESFTTGIGRLSSSVIKSIDKPVHLGVSTSTLTKVSSSSSSSESPTLESPKFDEELEHLFPVTVQRVHLPHLRAASGKA